MNSLIAAALFFVGIHLLISGTWLRAALVRRIGELPYLGLFSLLSAAALTWMVIAFTQAHEPIPSALRDWRWVAIVLNLVAWIFIAFGVLSKSPTAYGGERFLNNPDPVTGLHRVTRHPMLWGFALWAAVHMLFNPEPPALVFFGAFLALALIGPPSIDAKRAARMGEAWARYLALTSNVPFAAILAGRNRMVWRELLAPPLAAGIAGWALFLLLHGRLFKMPVL